jgi:hypothetical protein
MEVSIGLGWKAGGYPAVVFPGGLVFLDDVADKVRGGAIFSLWGFVFF